MTYYLREVYFHLSLLVTEKSDQDPDPLGSALAWRIRIVEVKSWIRIHIAASADNHMWKITIRNDKNNIERDMFRWCRYKFPNIKVPNNEIP
jgi:hypothetical protein